ncbi:hypothetical protein AT6N2_C3088 [Agrobacterium tumefaciens]|nr:hypothetical protein AT6N2_C3088 [Agrobacterium tumefaciens]
MQRVADIPDDLETDEAGEHEDDEVAHETCRRIKTNEQQDGRAGDQKPDLALRLRLELRLFLGVLFLRRQLFGFFLRLLRGNGLDLRRRRREGDLALIGNGRAPDDVVFHVVNRLAVLRGRQIGHHVADVGGVKRRGLRCHAAREIGVADDDDAIVGYDALVGNRQVAIAAALGGEVDDDRTRLHHRHHVGKPQLRGVAAGDQRRGDDDIHLRGEFAEFLQLLLAEFRRGGGGITAGRCTILLLVGKIEIDEFRAHGFDLLGHFRAHVEGISDRAERCGRADGGKTGNAGADDQHLGGRHLAGGRHLTGEEAAEIIAGLDDRTIAGDIGHGRQDVHLLGAGDTRHHVHGDDVRAFLLRLFQKVLVLGGIEERDQSLVRRQAINFRRSRRANLGDDIGAAVKRLGAVDHRHAGCAIGVVRKAGRLAGPCLDDALIAEFLQSLRAVRRHGDPRFTFIEFSWCPDSQNCSPIPVLISRHSPFRAFLSCYCCFLPAAD